ncbi:hypothetical protein ASALC70_02853 [Alcanivorax sp. ALC70]|nr:hypothetical protein ASALC70_02853 [Alcanivorax sp. ALC70]
MKARFAFIALLALLSTPALARISHEGIKESG